MSIQLYSHKKDDLERAVEVILKKANDMLLIRQMADNQSNTDELISQAEAAKFLKISLPTIIFWRKHRNLPHYNFNGRYFYSRNELLEYGRNKNRKA